MSRKDKQNDARVDSLKNESSRQRWELFHRAIAHAKESNNAAQADSDAQSDDSENGGPLLSIVR